MTVQKQRASADGHPMPKKRKPSIVANLAMLIAFLGIIFLGFVVYVFGDEREVSELEGRELTHRPEISVDGVLSGEYIETFESYANDQVFQRDRWMTVNGMVQKNVLRQRMNNGIFALSSGMLLEPSGSVNDFAGFKQPFTSFSNEMKEADIPVYFASAPSKSAFAKKQGLTPEYIRSNEDVSRENLNSVMEKSGLNVIDLYEGLSSETMEDIYFYNDHHWNIHGAYNGYEQIVQTLQETYPELEIVNKDQFESTTLEAPYHGSYARKVSLPYVVKNDYLEYWEPKNGFSTEVCVEQTECGREVLDRQVLKEKGQFADSYMAFMGGNYSELTIKQKNPKNDTHLLVLKDSYANPLLGLLGESVGKLSVLDVRYTEGKIDVAEYAKENGVDGVLFIHNDRINGMLDFYKESL
ncbi:MAG: hypothetical protein IKG65_11785 [Exiguobacterium sp.]|nr:hypothetical protein [Exiguobacterium sp.]MBR3215973.1 hypothetical protein [Exiguobacterium sp.]